MSRKTIHTIMRIEDIVELRKIKKAVILRMSQLDRKEAGKYDEGEWVEMPDGLGTTEKGEVVEVGKKYIIVRGITGVKYRVSPYDLTRID